jgi:hypothetical protein
MKSGQPRKGFTFRVDSVMDSSDRMLGLDVIVSPEELQDLVDRFGEDMTAWPHELREPAEELIDACAEARDIIAQARSLRVQLRKLGPKAPHCIVDRIVSIALDCDPPMDDVLRLKN